MTRAEIYKGLKKFRSDSAMTKVAEASGRHPNWVKLVLQGKYDDDNVMEIAKKVLKALEKKHQQRLAQAEKLVLG